MNNLSLHLLFGSLSAVDIVLLVAVVFLFLCGRKVPDMVSHTAQYFRSFKCDICKIGGMQRVEHKAIELAPVKKI